MAMSKKGEVAPPVEVTPDEGVDKHKVWLLVGIGFVFLVIAVVSYFLIGGSDAIAGRAFFAERGDELVPDYDIAIECLRGSDQQYVRGDIMLTAGDTLPCRLVLQNYLHGSQHPDSSLAGQPLDPQELPQGTLFGAEFKLDALVSGSPGGFTRIDEFLVAVDGGLADGDQLKGALQRGVDLGLGKKFLFYKLNDNGGLGLGEQTVTLRDQQRHDVVNGRVIATFVLRSIGVGQLPGYGQTGGAQAIDVALSFSDTKVMANGVPVSVTITPTPEVCSNGQDDDGDNLVDCADTYCRGDPGPGGVTCCQYDDATAGIQIADRVRWITDCTATNVCSPANTCGAAVCGDGTVSRGLNPDSPVERCDDGNTAGGDGCSLTCTIEQGFVCGNDPGTPSACSRLCGNGQIDSPETCDDGDDPTSGNDAGDGCNSCALESGWTCRGEPSVCTTTCGDGIIAGTEACDDDNVDLLDGCSDTCTVENGWACSNEPSTCTTTCGDGIRVGDESCDDGDTDPGDGCDNACNLESGWRCDTPGQPCERTVCPGGEENPPQCTDCGRGRFHDDAGSCRWVGDVTDDDAWTPQDINSAANHVVGNSVLSGDDFTAADANCDGTVDIEDLLVIVDATVAGDMAVGRTRVCTPSVQ